jgi:hypothetical protein
MVWVGGGCLCGAVRYEVDPALVYDSGYCHCSLCRRASGGPMVAWASLRAGGFRLTAGAPKWYVSSATGRRGFCADCGAQLFFDGPGMAGLTGVNTGTLDDLPAPLRPRLHMCWADKWPWFDISDSLPRFDDNRLTKPEERGMPTG